MRNHKGKAVAVWVPGNHGAGGSTITNAVGITLQHITGKDTLIVNMGSSRNYLEQYMKNDVNTHFSMDYLKGFDTCLRTEHIRTYASAINDSLYILPNCKLDDEVNKVSEGFYERFIDKALDTFDFVVIDLETGLGGEKQGILEKADLILAVMDDNVMVLKDLFFSDKAILSYVANKKTIPLLNGLHSTQQDIKIIRMINKILEINESYSVGFDINANKAASYEGKFYSFLKSELNKKNANTLMAGQIKELCSIIIERLLIPIVNNEVHPSLLNMLLSRAKHWGEVDA